MAEKASVHEAPKAESARPAPVRAPTGSLVRAGESTDPAVHEVMAKRFTYEQHITNVDADVAALQEQKRVALQMVDELDAQLADLGYK